MFEKFKKFLSDVPEVKERKLASLVVPDNFESDFPFTSFKENDFLSSDVPEDV